MARTTSNTGDKQAKKGRGGNLPVDGKETQFKKGYDPRRNMNGRPKAFDQWRKLAQDIGEQIATKKTGEPLLWNGQEITFAELVQLSWITDKKFMEKWAEAAFGKVPTDVNLNNPDGSLKQEIPVEQIAQRVVMLTEIAKKRKENDRK